MSHIDEHLLELYVLKSDLVEARRGEIEAHLAVCAGCRALMEEIKGFYADLSKSEGETTEPAPRMERALARRRQEMEPYYEPFAPPVPYRPSTLVGKFRTFVTRHPVAAGAGSFAAVGALAILMSSGLGKLWHDKNPSTFINNVALQRLEVYNRRQELLWDLKVPDIAEDQVIEHDRNVKRTIIADLDNSGRSEVLTALSPLGFGPKQGGHLRIYDGEKNNRLDLPFDADVRYLGRAYSPYFNPVAMEVLGTGSSGEKEIFVLTENLGRSPSALYRLDHDAETIGRYWHFGSLQCMYRDESGRLVIGGKNDTEDTTLGGYPMIAVIDPAKIVGERKSIACPGYRMDVSDAEIYYIQLPRSDIDEAAFTSGMTASIHDEDSTTLRILVSSLYPLPDGSGKFNFEYFFDHQMRALRVKSTNNTDALHAALAKGGKVQGTIDNAYLEALRNDIRYWDGKGWRSERVMVGH